MAKVPISEGNRVQARSIGEQRIEPVDVGAPARYVGEGVARFGVAASRAVAQLSEVEMERRQVASAASAGESFAGLRTEFDELAHQFRNEAPEDALGHTESYAARVDGQRETFLREIPHERVRQAYRERWAEMRERLIGRERDWEIARRSETTINRFDRSGSLAANRVTTDRTPEALEDALGDLDVQANLTRAVLPEGAMERLLREQKRKVVVSWANSLNANGEQEGLLNILQNGALNQYLEPEDIGQLRSGGMVERRRAEVAARALAAEREAEGREQLRLFSARISDGDEPSNEEFAEHARLAGEIGASADAWNIGVEQSKALINRETRDWTPQQFDTAINALLTKGDERTPAENVQLAQLQSIEGPRREEFNRDPQARAARMGNEAPPIDINAPNQAQVGARVAWAEGYAKANGLAVPPYLSEAEREALRQRAGPNLPGQLDVARYLRQTFGAGRAMAVAQSVDPGNETFHLATQMPQDTAAAMVRGVSARRNNPKIYTSAPFMGIGHARGISEEDARMIFREVAPAIPQEFREAVMQSALNIAAGTAESSGHYIVPEGIFRMALHRAAGSTGSNERRVQGGFHWYNNQPIWLPNDMTPDDFDRRVSRADGAALTRAAGSGVYFAGANGGVGRALTREEWKRARFQTVAPGVYQAIGPRGGSLLNDRGEPFTFDVKQLP